jgi:hypothetical protein
MLYDIKGTTFRAKGHVVRLDVVQVLLQTRFPKQLPMPPASYPASYKRARVLTTPASDRDSVVIFEAVAHQPLSWPGPPEDWR